jgi:hypothetical protein
MTPEGDLADEHQETSVRLLTTTWWTVACGGKAEGWRTSVPWLPLFASGAGFLGLLE